MNSLEAPDTDDANIITNIKQVNNLNTNVLKYSEKSEEKLKNSMSIQENLTLPQIVFQFILLFFRVAMIRLQICILQAMLLKRIH